MPTPLFKKIRQKIMENKDRSCRICADTLCEIGDKWIKPCSCKGSILWVHHNCLKKWMEYSSSTKCTMCNENYKIKTISSSKLSSFLFSSTTTNVLSSYFVLFIYYSFYCLSKMLNQKYKNYFFNWFYILRGISVLSIIFYISMYYLSKKICEGFVENVDDPYMILEDESLLLSSFIYVPKYTFIILKNMLQRRKTREEFEIMDNC
jgi:hypothetical protein